MSGLAEERLPRYGRRCVVAAVFLSPVVFSTATASVYNLPKLAAIGALGLLALALFLAWAAERGTWWPPTSLGAAGGVFLMACTLATVLSDRPAISLLGRYGRYGGLVSLGVYLAVMLAIVGLYAQRPHQVRLLGWAAAAGATVLAVTVLAEEIGLGLYTATDRFGRPYEFPGGTIGNSSFAGSYLGIATPFFVHAAATSQRAWHRATVISAAGVVLIALWFTQSRSGMLAAAVAMITMVVVYRKRLPQSLCRFTVLAVGVVVVVATLVIVQSSSDAPPGPLTRLGVLRSQTLRVRTDHYWLGGWRLFTADPVVGSGLGSYYADYPSVRPPADGARKGLTIPDKPHNILLDYAVGAGAVGLGAYLALIGFALRYAGRAIRSLHDPARLLLTSFVAALAAYLAQGFFSIDVPPLALTGWVALGGIAVLADPAVVRWRAHPRPGRVGSRRRWVAHAAIAAAALAIVAVGSRAVRADAQMQSGRDAVLALAPPGEVAGFYEAAIALHPFEPNYRTMAGQLAESRARQASQPAKRAGLLTEALGHYHAALRLDPGNVLWIVDVARTLTYWSETVDHSRFREAARWWDRAVARDPTDWEVHYGRADMLGAWAGAVGDPAIRQQAIAAYETVVGIRPDFLPAQRELVRLYDLAGRCEGSRAEEDLDQSSAGPGDQFSDYGATG